MSLPDQQLVGPGEEEPDEKPQTPAPSPPSSRKRAPSEPDQTPARESKLRRKSKGDKDKEEEPEKPQPQHKGSEKDNKEKAAATKAEKAAQKIDAAIASHRKVKDQLSECGPEPLWRSIVRTAELDRRISRVALQSGNFKRFRPMRLLLMTRRSWPLRFRMNFRSWCKRCLP